MKKLISEKVNKYIKKKGIALLLRFVKTTNKCSGYSMLEMLLATAVGGIVLAGAYTSYNVIGKQYQRISAFSEVQEAGMPTVRIIARDLRMAGRVAMDANVDPVYGIISTPIAFTDSADACCDSIVIIYDKSSTERRRVTYSTAVRTNPTRNALYMDIDLWSGTAWVPSVVDSLVTDYVDDFQAVGSDNNSSGNPMIVDLSLLLRSRSVLNTTQTFTPPNQVVGNYNYSFTDTYHRDEFTMTVNIKNLR